MNAALLISLAVICLAIAHEEKLIALEDEYAKLSDNEKATFVIPEGARILDSYTVTLTNPAAKIEAMRLLGGINGVSEVLDAEEAHHRMATLGGVTAGLSDEKYEEIFSASFTDGNYAFVGIFASSRIQIPQNRYGKARQGRAGTHFDESLRIY